MNDRLLDLLGRSHKDFQSNVINIPVSNDEPKDDMKFFFDQIENVKGDIEKIENASAQLDKLTDAAIFSSVDKHGESAKEKINSLIASTNQYVNRSKNILKAIKLDTDELKKDSRTANSGNIRMRENLINTYTRKFVDTSKVYQDKQTRYKAQVQGKAERAIKAVKPTVTEEELEAVFKQENGVSRVLEAAVIKQSGDPVAVSNVLAEVQDTYQAVRRLEASILELHQMFLDLAFLVEQQGETLNDIDAHVQETRDYVKKGNVHLEEAVVKAKSVRKRQCCIIAIIIAIIAILIIIIVLAT